MRAPSALVPIACVLAAAALIGLRLALGPVFDGPLDGLPYVVAVLLLFAAVAFAGPFRRAPAEEPAPAPEPMPADIAGVRMIVSAAGLSVPYGDGWRDFPDYAAFAADPSFPPNAGELALAEPEGAVFAVIGTRGAVLGADGAIVVTHDGTVVAHDGFAALFDDPRILELAPAPESRLVIDFLGHSYLAAPTGRLVPAAGGDDERAGTAAEILADPAHAERRRRFESLAVPGAVFAAIAGRPVRIGANGGVEWIRADGVFRFPSIADAMAAIGAA